MQNMTNAVEQRIAVETQDLVRAYGGADGVRALDGVSLTIAAGEFVTIMGPSGSGKSTLLNLIGALDLATSGAIRIDSRDLGSIRDLDTFRAKTVGFVFQMHNLIPTLNALENVEVPMMGQIRSRRHRRQRAAELLGLVGLSDRLDHLPSQLSGGERQRAAIARAFIIVTHDHAVARQTDRVILLQDGQISDDHKVGHPYEEDLKSFRNSGLGRALLSGDPDARGWLGDQGLDVLQSAL